MPLKTRPPRIGAYLVIFASPTTFRITTFKKTSSWSKTFKLGEPKQNSKELSTNWLIKSLCKALIDQVPYAISYIHSPSLLLTSWYIRCIPLIPLDPLDKYNCSLVDWTRWNLTQLGSTFMSTKNTHTHKLCWQASSLQWKHGKQNQVLNHFGTHTKTKLHII